MIGFVSDTDVIPQSEQTSTLEEIRWDNLHLFPALWKGINACGFSGAKLETLVHVLL